jgi:hypothetical protein
VSRPSDLRLAGLAGLLSIPLGVAGVLVDRMWTFPATDASAARIASFVGAHRSALLLAMALTTTAVALWLVFGVGVWVWLREMSTGDGLFSSCFLAGFASFVTLLLAGFTSFFVLVFRAPDASDPRLLYDLAFGLLAMSGVPTALALGCYAVQIFRGHQLPGWTAWLAALGSLAHLVLIASLVVTSGFFSLTGGVIIAIPATLFAWIAGTGVVMVRATYSLGT